MLTQNWLFFVLLVCAGIYRSYGALWTIRGIEQGLRFASSPAYVLVTPIALYHHVTFWENLLHNPLLKILCEIDTHHTGHMVSGNLLHIVFDHDLYEFLEGGGLWIPTQFILGLRGIAP